MHPQASRSGSSTGAVGLTVPMIRACASSTEYRARATSWGSMALLTTAGSPLQLPPAPSRPGFRRLVDADPALAARADLHLPDRDAVLDLLAAVGARGRGPLRGA